MAAAHAELGAHALLCIGKHTERLFIPSLRGKFLQFNGWTFFFVGETEYANKIE